MTGYQIQLKYGLVEQNSTPRNFSVVYLLIRTPVSHPDWGGGGGSGLDTDICSCSYDVISHLLVSSDALTGQHLTHATAETYQSNALTGQHLTHATVETHRLAQEITTKLHKSSNYYHPNT